MFEEGGRMEPYPLDEMIAKAQGGDGKATASLVHRYLPMVWGIALFHVGEPSRAATVVREVFSRAFATLGRVPDPGKFRRCLETITLSVVRGAGTSGSEGDQPAPGGESVLDAVRALPDGLRRPVVLRYFQGLTYGGIAARAGGTPETVDGLLIRAKDRVRRVREE
jgi:DNA-directed RNA polymerase specialized sigma24 family protein